MQDTEDFAHVEFNQNQILSLTQQIRNVSLVRRLSLLLLVITNERSLARCVVPQGLN